MLRSTASSLGRRAVHPSRLSSTSLSWLRTSTGVSISSNSVRISITPSKLTGIARMSSSTSSTPPHVSNLGNSSSDSGDKTFAVRHPSSPDVIVHTVQASTAADVSTAISAASVAQKAWARTSLDARRGIFLRAAQLLESGEGEWVKRVCEANKQETPCTDAWAGLQIGWMGPQLRQLAASVGEALRMEVHEVGGELGSQQRFDEDRYWMATWRDVERGLGEQRCEGRGVKPPTALNASCAAF